MTQKFTGLNFDATQVAPDQGREPLPPGWYAARITDSELKPTKDGTGTRLNLTFQIIGGQFNDRKVLEGLNVRNANADAQKIAQGQLSAICHAIGVLTIQDTQQLHNIPLNIRLKIRPADGQYDARNEITAYKNINEPVEKAGAVVPGMPGAAPAAPAMPSAPAGFGAPAPTTPPAAPAAPAAANPAAAAPAQPWEQPPAQAAQPAAPAAPAEPTAPAAPAGGVLPPWATAGAAG